MFTVYTVQSLQIHHEWTAPFAIAALYSHPLEHLFTGQVSHLFNVLKDGLFYFLPHTPIAKSVGSLLRSILFNFLPSSPSVPGFSSWALPSQLPGSGSA